MASINDKLAQAVVGMAGLGGLGSTVAAALARSGIGKLIIADFDVIEAGNLNRQQYFVHQIGKDKVEATIENLRCINPDVQVAGHHCRLTADNIPGIFAEAEIIAECFDRACEKQMIVETVLYKTDKKIVSASGLTGYGDSNVIVTKYISERLILVGDGKSDVESNPLLTAARVWIAAAHQANAIVEMIIDQKKS